MRSFSRVLHPEPESGDESPHSKTKKKGRPRGVALWLGSNVVGTLRVPTEVFSIAVPVRPPPVGTRSVPTTILRFRPPPVGTRSVPTTILRYAARFRRQ